MDRVHGLHRRAPARRCPGSKRDSHKERWYLDTLLDPPLTLAHGGPAMRSRGNGITAGQRHWASPWVLAMLCLRAFIPAGFMLAPVEGRPAVVLCDTDAAPSHRHAGHEQAGSHHHAQFDPTCPYAQSAGPAPLPVLPALEPQPVLTTLRLPEQLQQVFHLSGPPRQHSARAPPSFT
jgi:hypothetical protein